MNWDLVNSTPYGSSVKGGVVIFLNIWVVCFSVFNVTIIISQNVYGLTNMISSTVLNTDVSWFSLARPTSLKWEQK